VFVGVLVGWQHLDQLRLLVAKQALDLFAVDRGWHR
jgi:hypothetical protein